MKIPPFVRKVLNPNILVILGLLFVFGNNALNVFGVASYIPLWLVQTGYVLIVLSSLVLLPKVWAWLRSLRR